MTRRLFRWLWRQRFRSAALLAPFAAALVAYRLDAGPLTLGAAFWFFSTLPAYLLGRREAACPKPTTT